MADNTTLQSSTLASPPAGEVFGFDDVGGVKIARSKTGFGTDGSYTDVSASDPLPVTAASLPLPSGAATSAKQDTLIGHVDGLEGLLTTIDADTGAIATAAATLAGAVAGTEVQVDVLTMPPVAITGGVEVNSGYVEGAVDASIAGFPILWEDTGDTLRAVSAAKPLPVSAASLPLPSGAATAAKQPALGTAGSASSDVLTVQGITSMTPLAVSDDGGSLTVDAPVGTPVFVRLSDGSSAIATLPVSLASLPALAAGTNAIGKLAANSGVDIGDVDVTSVPTSSSATLTNQTDQATSAQLLASNAARKGFAVFNESPSFLYVKFGTTASATDYTVRIDPYGYFEHMGVGIYTGRVDGIWSADASGSARTTEW